jgi:uncharacterized protein (DUF2384 family)
MQLLSSQSERHVLEELDNRIQQWIQIVRDEADCIDPEQFHRFRETAQRLALRLDEQLPPSLDPAVSNEIRAVMIGGLRRVDELGDDRPLDVLDDFILRAESIRHIVRDALDEDVPADPKDTQTLATLVVDWLPTATRIRLAKLLGVNQKTLKRWVEAGGPPSRRLFIVANLVLLLKDAWTAEGVLAWFERPRRDLDGRRPIEVIDDPDFERALIEAAREGRAQHGS